MATLLFTLKVELFDDVLIYLYETDATETVVTTHVKNTAAYKTI